MCRGWIYISPTEASRAARFGRGFVACCFASHVALFLTCGCGVDVSKGPVLAAKPLSQQIRPDSGGSDAVAHFELRNIGDAVLEILEVDPGCGCAVAELPRRSLRPGEATTLAVKVSAASIGSRAVTVAVNTNSSTTPRCELQILCEAADQRSRIVGVSPQRVILDATVTDVRKPVVVAVTALEERANAIIRGLSCDLPFVQIEADGLQETVLPSGAHVQRTYRFRVSVEDQHPIGRFVSSLRVQVEPGHAPPPGPPAGYPAGIDIGRRRAC